MKQLKDILEGIFDVDSNVENMDRVLIEKFIKENYTARKIHISDTKNNDGKYEVSASDSVIVDNDNIKTLTNDLFIFTNVVGNFNCSWCPKLKNLKGAPEIVMGEFKCNNCDNLESLEGAPRTAADGFDCSNCRKLKSLKGITPHINNLLKCDHCGEKFEEKYIENLLSNHCRNLVLIN